MWEVVPRMVCSQCGSVFYWGHVLYRPMPGVNETPIDCLAPQFADVQAERYHKGASVNSLRQLSADGISWTPIDHTPK